MRGMRGWVESGIEERGKRDGGIKEREGWKNREKNGRTERGMEGLKGGRNERMEREKEG